MQPTLQNIASELGVSTATVSNTLSGKGRVSEALKERIKEKVQSLGYKPNIQGRALRTGRSGVLGLILPDISNPLFPAIAQSVEAAAAKSGYGVLIADSQGDTGAQTEALKRLVRQGADGIIIIPRRGTRVMKMDLPIAMIDTASTPGNSVSADHWGGGVIAVQHLRDLGHKKLALIGKNRNSSVQNDRIGGMKTALGADIHAQIFWLEDKPNIDFSALARAGFTGFIATSDMHALTSLTQFQRAGIPVPEQVSVMGFDDLSFSQAIAPSLTTMAQDTHQIASHAVTYLAAQIAGATVPKECVIAMSLIKRESTGFAKKTDTNKESAKC